MGLSESGQGLNLGPDFLIASNDEDKGIFYNYTKCDIIEKHPE